MMMTMMSRWWYLQRFDSFNYYLPRWRWWWQWCPDNDGDDNDVWVMMSTTVDSFNYYLSTFLHSLIPLRTNLNNSRFSLNLFLWNILTIFPQVVFMEYFDEIPSISFYGIFWQYSLNLFLWNILTIFSQFVFLWNILTVFPQLVFYGIFWQYSLNLFLWNILTTFPQFLLRA